MFVIFGIGGRNSFRRAFEVGQSKRKCATVSCGHGQRGHIESVITPIFLRCELRGACWDLSRKMVTCFLLFSEFMGSFGLGFVM